MANSSERSPPPFPDSEDQELLESEEVEAQDNDDDDDEDDNGDDIFLTAPLTKMDTALPTTNQPADADPVNRAENKPASEVVSKTSNVFVDLTNNETDAPGDAVAAESAIADSAKESTEIPLDEHTDDFADMLGNETEASCEEVLPGRSEVTDGIKNPLSDVISGCSADQEVKGDACAPVIVISCDSPANNPQQPPLEPLVDLISDAPPADVQSPSRITIDLFEDAPIDLFMEPRQTKSAKQPQKKSLFDEPDEDLFSEPLGAPSKKTIHVVSIEQDRFVMPKGVGGPLNDNYSGEPTDIFTEEAVATAPRVVGSKSNGVHSEEQADVYAEATVELSLDSPQNDRKKKVLTKPPVSAPSLSLAASLSNKSQSSALEELEEEEEEDKFEINISITNPEKIGDGMNAYMAYRVSTQTTLPMFRNKTFTVRRRFSDFLGLYEKLSDKHGSNGFIVPPPPEKSIMGMTKVKVGKEDPSSAEFVERRRAALERYLQRVVCHPSLLQDPDVREFLEREELPRAVNTQTLSGAGFLKMINRATDAVSKMTIKMNESDVWFEEKLQEVESADQQFRKLHALVESLVVHRKELSVNTAGFAKSMAMLGSSEDNTALSRALSQLAEVEDKMEQLHQEQASADSFNLAELIADYIRLLGAVRGSFDHRMKAWQRWQDAQATLQKKRETEAKLLWANKPDKLQQAKDEIVEWEATVTQYERDFDCVSATVRKEVVRFETEKVMDFRRQVIRYMDSMLHSQQQLMKYWEAFLPEAKAIA